MTDKLYRPAVVLLLCAILSACAPSADAIGTAIAQTEAARPTVTFTPFPTRTPSPTNTQKPTKTPQPTFTPTPIPTPIVISGSGDSVVDIKKWSGIAIVHITYNGDGNFIVQNYGKNNKQIDLLVNTIGDYEGTRPLDFLDNEQTVRFQIEATGKWEISVLPFEEVRQAIVPGVVEGKGDDVIVVYGDGKPDTLTIDANQADSNFIIYGWGNQRELLVNEIAPYSGIILVPANLPTTNGVLGLVVKATGNWLIDVKTK